MKNDFTVQLEQVFKGPMDLLLHLVHEQEVEIHEIEIHKVIEGYFSYLTALEALDIEVAGDFLVMAATLMAIKSRSLLPRDEVDLEDELDPEDELIQRLIEYRRFKSAAEDLELRRLHRACEHERGYKHEVRDNEPERTIDLGELTSWDLLSVFSRLMRETLANRTHHVQGDPRPLRWYVSQLGAAVRSHRRVSLRGLIVDQDEEPTKEGLIGSFCALLELMRLGVVTAEQEEEEIFISLVEEANEDIDLLINASHFMDEDEPETDAPAADMAPTESAATDSEAAAAPAEPEPDEALHSAPAE